MVKKLFLGLLLIPLILIVIPVFNIAGNKIEYIDAYFKEQNVAFTDFKRGYGIYPTQKYIVDYVSSSLDNPLSNEEFNNINNVIKARINLSELVDINYSGSFNENKYTFVFEFPEYYLNPSKYIDWLLVDGEFSFSTAEETSTVLDLKDTDIIGEINIDFLPQAGSNLVFDFKSDLELTLNSAFATNQNSIFYMSVDNQISFFITPYDQYVETKPTTVRAFPALSSITTLQELNDYLRISKTYFATDTINLSSYNKSISSTTLEPVYKNVSLTLIGVSVGVFTLIPLIINTYINKEIVLSDLKNKRNVLKYLLKRIILISIFNLTLLFLLKFSGAVLSIYLILGYLISIIIFEYLVLNINNLKKDINTYLIVSFILILILLKFSYLTYELSNILAVIQFAIMSFWLTKLYSNTFKFLKLNINEDIK